MTWLIFSTFPPRLRARIEAESIEEVTQKMGCKKGSRKDHVWVPKEISEYAGQELQIIAFDTWWKNIKEVKEPYHLEEVLRKPSDH